MQSLNIVFLVTFIIVFACNMMVFKLGDALLGNKPKLLRNTIFTLINTYIVLVDRFDLVPYSFTSFLVILVLTPELMTFVGAKFKQALLYATMYGFHFLAFHFVVLAIASRILQTAPLEILDDPNMRAILLGISFFVLLVCLFLIRVSHRNQQIASISTSSPYVEILLLFDFAVLIFFSLCSHFIISENYYREQVQFAIGVTIICFAFFYYTLYYTAHLISLSMFKRQSDEVQEKYSQLLSEKLEFSDKINLDNLTKLYNKKYIMNSLERLWANQDTSFGLLFLDVNSLKYVNDTYGHETGDYYIKIVANAIKDSIRENDLPARISGDEFLIVLRNADTLETVEIVKQRIKSAVNSEYISESFIAAVAIGAVFVDAQMHQKSVQEILMLTDEKMRDDKAEFYEAAKLKKGDAC